MKKDLFFKSEKQVTIGIGMEMHPWLQLVPQAALPFCGPELLVRLLFHSGLISHELCDC